MAAQTGSYVPPPSVGHEIGVMFGFLAVMALAMVAYGIAWQIGNRRSAREESERVEALRASGFLGEKREGAEERREDRAG
ncbi:hypothetical protein LTR66_008452 [Elasticomyces elasticus]|nr:hypothetical protein LTR66_008452 [Elasticomyces elasticus]